MECWPPFYHGDPTDRASGGKPKYKAREIGRIRLRRVPDGSADSLQAFIDEVVEPGSLVHTDGWLGYERLKAHGYRHRITFLGDHPEPASELLPRVHLVASLLKRWLLGTHQGAVSPAHLDYYLDEFTFRFNRRRSKSRGKLFFRLVQQAVAVEPIPLDRILHPGIKAKAKPQPVGVT
jgi:transposase-like protein